MRLSPEEIEAIRNCAVQHFGADATVRLFGSRLDDRRRGGDIDLHIETSDPCLAALDVELDFIEDLKGRIGDQKIDVIVRHAGDPGVMVDTVARQVGVVLS